MTQVFSWETLLYFIVAVAYLILLTDFAFKLRPWRFGLQTLLIEVTVIAVVLGLISALLSSRSN